MGSPARRAIVSWLVVVGLLASSPASAWRGRPTAPAVSRSPRIAAPLSKGASLRSRVALQIGKVKAKIPAGRQLVRSGAIFGACMITGFALQALTLNPMIAGGAAYLVSVLANRIADRLAPSTARARPISTHLQAGVHLVLNTGLAMLTSGVISQLPDFTGGKLQLFMPAPVVTLVEHFGEKQIMNGLVSGMIKTGKKIGATLSDAPASEGSVE